MRKHKQENHWISLSDIMTGLMVIFMFISISYIHQMKQKQKERDQILEEYKNVKIALYQELKKEFEKDFAKDKWDAIIGEDLSIRFQNEKVLFDYDKSELKPEFKKILDSFFPRYFKILLKYKKYIAEVRIEGHTDSRGDYMYNLSLSHARTASVLEYFFTSKHSPYHQLNKSDQKLVRFWLTATGFSWGRVVDKDGNYVLTSYKPEDRKKSRRVEFRVVTKTDAVVKEILKRMEN